MAGQTAHRRVARVTVRIEEEITNKTESDPLFGMWRDREEMADVEAYIGKLSASRY